MSSCNTTKLVLCRMYYCLRGLLSSPVVTDLCEEALKSWTKESDPRSRARQKIDARGMFKASQCVSTNPSRVEAAYSYAVYPRNIDNEQESL